MVNIPEEAEADNMPALFLMCLHLPLSQPSIYWLALHLKDSPGTIGDFAHIDETWGCLINV